MTQRAPEPSRQRSPRNDSSSGPRFTSVRPSSPWQLVLYGIGACLVAVLIPALGFLIPVGLIALAVAAVTHFMRPRNREMYWRGRRIELDGPSTWSERLYRTIYGR